MVFQGCQTYSKLKRQHTRISHFFKVFYKPKHHPYKFDVVELRKQIPQKAPVVINQLLDIEPSFFLSSNRNTTLFSEITNRPGR